MAGRYNRYVDSRSPRSRLNRHSRSRFMAAAKSRPASCYPVSGFPSGEHGAQVFDRPRAHRVTGLDCGAADMRQQENIVEFAVTRMNPVGLAVVDIEARGRDDAVAQ